jgi:hypothetical protein
MVRNPLAVSRSDCCPLLASTPELFARSEPMPTTITITPQTPDEIAKRRPGGPASGCSEGVALNR